MVIKAYLIFSCMVYVLFTALFAIINVSASDSVLISEVNYDPISNPLDEYFEITIRNDSGTDIDTTGWLITTFDESLNFTLPDIIDFGEFDYLSIRTGSGIDDLDATDGSATVYLSLSSDILHNSADEIALYDASNNLIDFVRYNGGNDGIVLGGWSAGDLGPITITGESIQIHGEDEDSSNNWLSGPPTEANPNKLNMEIEDGFGTVLVVEVTNGANRPVESDPEEKPRGLGFNVTRSPAVSLEEVKIVQEMMNFSFNYFKARGFNNPRVTPSGLINLTLTKTNKFEASAGPNGTMEVDLGGNLSHKHIASFIKWNVEHEFYHLLGYEQLLANGTAAQNGQFDRDITAKTGGRFACFDEGAAEFWGLEISKAQYNVTEEFLFNVSLNLSNIYRGTFNSIPYNLSEILMDFDFDLTRLRTSSGEQVYNHGYLLNKYIAETYGSQKLFHIHNVTRNNLTGMANTITGQQAIEKAFKDEGINKTLEQLWSDWREWIYLTYSDKITFTTTQTFNGSTLNEIGTLNRWGTDYELFNINLTIPFNITIAGTSDGNYSVSTIIEYKNGSREIIRDRFTGTGVGNTTVNNLIAAPTNISRIILVKTKIDDQPFLFSYNVTFTRFNSPPNITSSIPVNRSIAVAKNSSTFFNVTAKDNENDPLTYNWTINSTQVAFSTPNFTFTPNITGNFTLNVFITDEFGGSANTSWNITVLANTTLTLRKGWNLFSPIIDPFFPGNKSLQFRNGWNLFGFSGDTPFIWRNAIFNNGTATKNVSEAQTAGWLQATINYYDADAQVYKTVVISGAGEDHLRRARGHWIYTTQNLTMTLPNTEGSLTTATFPWLNAKITRADQTKSINDAQTAGWLQGTIYSFDAIEQKYKLIPGTGGNNTQAWRGYWLYAFEDNMTLMTGGAP